MKKILVLIICLLLLAGCSKKNDPDIKNNFVTKIGNLKSYEYKGTLTLEADEESYRYDLTVINDKEKYFVDMTNVITGQRQIILKNQEGLYVLTPLLNKSYKFDSAWPDNSSQSYILSSIRTDILNTSEVEIKKKDNLYCLKTNVNYPQDSTLKYQHICVNDDLDLKTVEVYNNNGMVKIKVEVNDIKYNNKIDENVFNVEKYVTEVEEQGESKTMESAIYPLYMPVNTYLTSSEVIDNEGDKRIILTFNGEKNFVVVEEALNASSDLDIIPVSGEPLILVSSVAALSSNSMYWTNDDVSFYLASNDLSIEEMVSVASSIGNEYLASIIK